MLERKKKSETSNYEIIKKKNWKGEIVKFRTVISNYEIIKMVLCSVPKIGLDRPIVGKSDLNEASFLVNFFKRPPNQ